MLANARSAEHMPESPGYASASGSRELDVRLPLTRLMVKLTQLRHVNFLPAPDWIIRVVFTPLKFALDLLTQSGSLRRYTGALEKSF